MSARQNSERRLWPVAVLSASLIATACASGFGADAALTADARKAQQDGVNFLRTTQADDGSWTNNTQPGISALCVYGLLRSGVPADDPTVAKGLKHLLGFAQEDGGLYHPKSNHKNYETSIALMALVEANKDGSYDAQVAAAEKFLKDLQWDEGEGKEPSDTFYGGAGYGGSARPDMSNTSFLLEALRSAGVKEDDHAMQKALVFVSRSQNLETEHNTTPFAAKVNDGGFYYTPAAGGTSQAGLTEEGGLRSYGSMTYAGLKSMIYAGLTKDDPRVKAALEWLRKNYRLDENPGMAQQGKPGTGQQGLYYYYHTMAKSLAVLGEDRFEDADGVEHDWRRELAAKLVELQKENGSWVNSADRWYEGDPNLVTAYSLMALSYLEPETGTSAGAGTRK